MQFPYYSLYDYIIESLILVNWNLAIQVIFMINCQIPKASPHPWKAVVEYRYSWWKIVIFIDWDETDNLIFWVAKYGWIAAIPKWCSVHLNLTKIQLSQKKIIFVKYINCVYIKLHFNAYFAACTGTCKYSRKKIKLYQ